MLRYETEFFCLEDRDRSELKEISKNGREHYNF